MQRIEKVIPPLVAVLADTLAAQASLAAQARELAHAGDIMAALGELQGLESGMLDSARLLDAVFAARRALGGGSQ